MAANLGANALGYSVAFRWAGWLLMPLLLRWAGDILLRVAHGVSVAGDLARASIAALTVDDVVQWLSVEEAAQVVGEQPAVRLPGGGVAAAGDVRGQQDLR